MKNALDREIYASLLSEVQPKVIVGDFFHVSPALFLGL
jgi:hypothetical protein